MRLWLWLVSLAAAAYAGYWWAGQARRGPALILNGQEVALARVEQTLQLYRQPAVEGLILEQAVALKARQMGIQVDEASLRLPQLSEPDAELAQTALARTRTQALLRILVLHEFTQEDRRQVYSLFRQQLTGDPSQPGSYEELLPAIEEILYRSRVRLYTLDLQAESNPEVLLPLLIPSAELPGRELTRLRLPRHR